MKLRIRVSYSSENISPKISQISLKLLEFLFNIIHFFFVFIERYAKYTFQNIP